ncbi:MAG: hypothetical protein IT384_18960 [Deltaproteobacteria bacterium]|nr:hypothetical protein [Deltaproteobacteria bacterium]
MLSRKLPEPYTFFIDRCLGERTVPEALRAEGYAIRLHSELFEDAIEDAVWLPEVGRRNLVVLTKDRAIRRNKIERDAILTAGVVAFLLSSGDATAQAMASTIIGAMRSIHRALRRFPAPFIATVTAQGRVSVLYDAGGRLTPPKAVR